MDLRVLRNRVSVFAEVVAAGGITRAARRLHISQPAVSGQIRELEKEIGAPLFDRGGRRFTLTDVGRSFAEYVQRLREIESEAVQAIEAHKGLRRGRLAVGASETPGHYVLLAPLAEFRRNFPDVTLRVAIGSTPMMAERVLDGLVDVAFVEGELHDSRLTVHAFRDDRLRLIVARGDPLAKRRGLRAKDLTNRDFVMREPHSAVRGQVDAALERAGLRPRVALELGTTEAVKRAVEAGLGIALVPQASLEADLQSGRLRSPRVAGLEARRSLWVVRSSRRALSPTATALVRLVEASS